MKVYSGSRGIVPLILKLRTRYRRVVNFTTWSLYVRERIHFWLNRRLGGIQTGSGRFAEEKYLLSLASAVIRTPDGPTCSLDTIPTFNNIENGMVYVKSVLHIKHVFHVSLRRLWIKRALFISDKYLASYGWSARKLSCKYISLYSKLLRLYLIASVYM
jgi:hypothetical protein